MSPLSARVCCLSERDSALIFIAQTSEPKGAEEWQCQALAPQAEEQEQTTLNGKCSFGEPGKDRKADRDGWMEKQRRSVPRFSFCHTLALA
eukprot:scaffold55_cov237-Pinguiococcus_pyrenoidosus.AAC.8